MRECRQGSSQGDVEGVTRQSPLEPPMQGPDNRSKRFKSGGPQESKTGNGRHSIDCHV